MSKIATIIINYNGSDDTLECLNSLLFSSIKTDAIVIDNNSNEEEIKKLETSNIKHKLIKNNNNLGFAGGNNIGIKYAIENGYEYILLLNNDTVVAPDMIKKLISHMASNTVMLPKMYQYKNPEKIWYDGGYISKIVGKAYHYHEGKKDGNTDDRELKECSFATGCCMLANTDVFIKNGLMNEDYFLYSEDVDFSIRLQNNNIRIVYNPEAKLWHKESGTTGKKSELTTYYLTRNRLFLINNHKEYFKPMALIFSLMTFYIKIVCYRIVGNDVWRVYYKAIRDYRNNIIGKVDEYK